MEMTKRMLTTGDVGRYCGVHFRTVSRWIAQGRLKGHRLPGGRGDYRVQTSDFLAFLHDNGLPVPEELADTRRRVLILEEDELVAHRIECALSDAGFETQIAADGFQAGVLLHSFSPAVMTLEPKTVGAGGFDTLRFLCSAPQFSSVKVLVVSSLSNNELQHAIALGAADAVPKPFDVGEIVAKVSLLAGGDAAWGGARAGGAHG